MLKADYYLDKRGTKIGHPVPLKARLTFRGKTVLVNLDLKILPKFWSEKRGCVVGCPEKDRLNDYLTARMIQINAELLRLDLSDKLKIYEPEELKAVLEGREISKETFLGKYISFMNTRSTPGTRVTYHTTLVRMKAFDPKLAKRSFEDINKDWLRRFDVFLAKTNCRNARNVHYRNIRAVFNDAIDDEITTAYPFRKFKLKSEPTRKRSLSVEQLRLLRDYPVEEFQREYRDVFMLMFYLCGVNAVDLLNAPKTAIRNGRFEYVRSKTHKPYSIKVEPEAQEIIDRYAGEKYLLDIMDDRKNYKDWLHRMGRALKSIGECTRSGLGGKKTVKPLFPDLSQYWCRHTWATMAAELDIPKETIAAGLGHGSNTVTDIYIRFNYRKVDAANRKVIDYVSSDEVANY